MPAEPGPLARRMTHVELVVIGASTGGPPVLELILSALRSPTLNFEGKYYRFKDVPMELAPVQKPHPPLWYGVINPDATPWLAKNRVNIVSHTPAPLMGTITARYRAEFRAAQAATRRCRRWASGATS